MKNTKEIDARALRIKTRLNQSKFWTPLGVTQSCGSRYESGRPIPEPVRKLLVIGHGTDKQSAEEVAKLRGKESAKSTDLHESMMRFKDEVSATPEAAREFLERIGGRLSDAQSKEIVHLGLELARQRDELLEAMKKSRQALAAASTRAPEFKADYDAADSAIAAIEGRS